MTDAPKRIGLIGNGLGQWALATQEEAMLAVHYIIASEHAHIVAEKDARIAVMRKALMAFEQHEASHFRGPDA